MSGSRSGFTTLATRSLPTLTLALSLALSLAAPLVLPSGAHAGSPVGGAFTYQGRLMQLDEPFTGTAEVSFQLFDQLTGAAAPDGLVANAGERGARYHSGCRRRPPPPLVPPLLPPGLRLGHSRHDPAADRDLPLRRRLRRGAEPPIDLAAEAECTDLQSTQIGQSREFAAEPAAA